LPATLLIALAPAVAHAQQPPVRRLGPTVAASTELFGNIATARQLAGGRVLLNDVAKRRILLVDSTLATATVLVDSASGANSYGMRGVLIPYADSTLFADASSLSFLVFDPNGKIARVMSAPRASDAPFLTITASGAPAVDAQGRLVYVGRARLPPMAFGPGQPFVPPAPPDSATILRVDLATRKLDTAAWLKIPKTTLNVTTLEKGGMSITTVVNPMPVADDWMLMPDGAIAIMRARDYHIDWVNPDGTRTSSPKIPYDWQRLTDEDKIAVIDSAKKAIEQMRATTAANQATRGNAGGAGDGRAGAGAEGRMRIEIGGRGEGAVAMGAPGGLLPPGANIDLVSPSELPDYRPPFRPGTARVDLDGNLWIASTPAKDGAGPIYDVVNRRGELVDRVQVPVGRSVVGFGAGGIVYLVSREVAGARLERAKLR